MYKLIKFILTFLILTLGMASIYFPITSLHLCNEPEQYGIPFVIFEMNVLDARVLSIVNFIVSGGFVFFGIFCIWWGMTRLKK